MQEKTNKKQAQDIHKTFDQSSDAVTSFTPPPSLPTLDPENQSRLSLLLSQGYIIIPNAISLEQVNKIKQTTNTLLQNEQHLGRNNFEGRSTSRLYALLGKSRIYDQLLIHPTVTSLLSHLLSPNYLVTASQAIDIHPNETPQPWHYDDSFCHFPRPRKWLSVATMWAIDPFTSANGATVLFPNSHKWDSERLPTQKDEQVSCCMSPGSVALFLGTTWHGGGRNVSDINRMGVSFQYCEPFLRPQENQFFSVPFSEAKKLPKEIQSLLGYSIHPPFIGHSNGLHPLKALAKM